METKLEGKNIVETKEKPQVEFGNGHALAIAAVFAGATIAIGVSAVVLGLGHDLTAQMQLWLVVLAVSIGGLTSLTAAFFGTVMPSAVRGKWDPPCETREVNEPENKTTK
jgi:hypothetical protein